MSGDLLIELTARETATLAVLLDAEIKRMKKRTFVQADLDRLLALRAKLQAELDTVVLEKVKQ